MNLKWLYPIRQNSLYNDLAEAILSNVSEGNEMKSVLTQFGQAKGLGGLKLREKKNCNYILVKQ